MSTNAFDPAAAARFIAEAHAARQPGLLGDAGERAPAEASASAAAPLPHRSGTSSVTSACFASSATFPRCAATRDALDT